MKLVKSLLLGSAAGLATVAAAQAADLPVRKAAPVEYVRVCDAYGAGFFYIPGTDTCLRVGGLVLAQLGIQPSTQLYGITQSPGVAIGALPAFGVAGAVPSPAVYRPVTGREIYGYNATGRIELDARTQTPFGTVRSFVRLTSQYGSASNYTTGSLQTALGLALASNTAGPTVSKEVTYLDKAFIQFAGITAGRVQSFFDFYADAINYEALRGSNQTTWAAAYTYTAAGGFSGTISMEDQASHRGDVASVIGNGTLTGIAGAPATAFGVGSATALVGASRMPDIVGNLRWDQPWGAAQISGALHQVRANLFDAAGAYSGVTSIGGTPAAPTFASGGSPQGYAFPLNSQSKYGFAVQGGLQFNLDNLAPGDKLWLQATYARGSIGYVQGNNLAFTQGVNATSNYGRGVFRSDNSVGWTLQADYDCVFTYSSSCKLSSAFAVVAAFKHYWTPTVSSSLFGSYYNVRYPGDVTTPINLVAAAGGGGSLLATGIGNFQETRLGTNLVWTPVKNFDLGAEIAWNRYMSQRPFGLAPDYVLQAYGLPKFAGTNNQYLGKLRMIRAF